MAEMQIAKEQIKLLRQELDAAKDEIFDQKLVIARLNVGVPTTDSSDEVTGLRQQLAQQNNAIGTLNSNEESLLQKIADACDKEASLQQKLEATRAVSDKQLQDLTKRAVRAEREAREFQARWRKAGEARDKKVQDNKDLREKLKAAEQIAKQRLESLIESGYLDDEDEDKEEEEEEEDDEDEEWKGDNKKEELKEEELKMDNAERWTSKRDTEALNAAKRVRTTTDSESEDPVRGPRRSERLAPVRGLRDYPRMDLRESKPACYGRAVAEDGFTFEPIISYSKDDPVKIEARENLSAALRHKIDTMVSKWQEKHGSNWRKRFGKSTEDSLASERECVSSVINGKTTWWGSVPPGQFACGDCVIKSVPCFSWTGSGFMMLPLHDMHRDTIYLGTDECRWVNGL